SAGAGARHTGRARALDVGGSCGQILGRVSTANVVYAARPRATTVVVTRTERTVNRCATAMTNSTDANSTVSRTYRPALPGAAVWGAGVAWSKVAEAAALYRSAASRFGLRYCGM